MPRLFLRASRVLDDGRRSRARNPGIAVAIVLSEKGVAPKRILVAVNVRPDWHFEWPE